MAAVLVVYATRDGQTRKIAERIANVLRVRRHVVELLDAARAPRDVDLSRFQAVFIGSSVHAGGYLRPVVRFVQSHRAELERLPTLFFSVGLAILSILNDGRAQTMRLVDRLIAETGWHPRRIELVAGALPYSRYNFLIRFVMRRIARKEGMDTNTSRDYEYTDWAAVDRFAAEFVDQVTASRRIDVPLPGRAKSAREACA
ncbi:MAG TPA: flavodoxin domain-containing protein [Myxococcaceae bacterium]|nr:flavodoxin domain-containing protein [Myxococcaceae bacterium]